MFIRAKLVNMKKKICKRYRKAYINRKKKSKKLNKKFLDLNLKKKKHH